MRIYFIYGIGIKMSRSDKWQETFNHLIRLIDDKKLRLNDGRFSV